MLLCRAFLAGFAAGLRSLTAPAAVSWAAREGCLDLRDTPMSFMASGPAPLIFTALALGELVADKLPVTPDRRKPPSFAFRIASGACCGAAIGAAESALLPALVAGAAGAIAGTLGGASGRAQLAKAFGCDLPAALTEDAAAVGVASLALVKYE